MKKHIAVVLGGWGEEREISLQTGAAVSRALAARGHRVTEVLAGPGLDERLREVAPDVAFLALHGRLGEDGSVQGLCEVLGIPYTGSGVLASALAMNKGFAKQLFQLHNLPTPRGYTVRAADAAQALERHGDLGFPAIVKPARGGSSVGMTRVERASELHRAVAQAASYGGEALVERQAHGREVTVGILDGQVLGSCEVAFSAETFDFAAKYQTGASHFLPPRLSPARTANVEALASAAYQVLGCRGHARVDFICGEADNELLLEVNTLPGLTPTSLLPKIADAAGIGFGELCERILALAFLDSHEGQAGELSRRRLPLRVAG